MQPTKVSVGTTPVELVAGNGLRKSLTIINRGSADIYLGNGPTLTIATGIVLRPQENMSADRDPDAYWGVAAAGTQQVDVMEIAT